MRKTTDNRNINDIVYILVAKRHTFSQLLAARLRQTLNLNYMIVQCPSCYSENVTNLSADSNDFICNDCGEDFQADNGISIEDDIDE